MTTTTLDDPTTVWDSARETTALTVAGGVAAATSAAAGLVHAAAAGSHNGDRVLALLFAVAAVLQLGSGWVAATRPGRATFALTGAVNLAAFAAWVFTRNAGVPFISGLEEPQEIALADASAAAFEVLAVLGAIVAASTSGRRSGAPRSAFVALGAVALFGAVPAMAAPHEHSEGAGHTDVAAANHGHTAEDNDTFLGITLPKVDGITDDQKFAAAKLIKDTRAAVAKYADTAAAEAAGFRSIGDGRTGFEHYVNGGYLVNANVLDPDEPESLVFEVNPDGTKTLASAMYILPPGKTMADVPDVAGPLTTWHDHQNLCWDASGVRLAGILVNGQCRPGGTFRPTPPMLHVWVTEHPCGPFAGIEGGGHTGACHSHTD